MNSTSRAKAIFLQALEISSPAERAALVDRECGGDAALRQQVEGLLAAHEAGGSFLEKPAAALEQTIDSGPASPRGEEQPGTRIGPYKLLEQIGEGGMGTVWMAEQQEPVRRTVALKLIKPGMDSRAVLARFDAERQALALMDHPNIARVLDAGTTDSFLAPPGGERSGVRGYGRPYFVMELVKGTPITTFCDERRVPMREPLSLFVQVCQAIQHAHQKGVIHRDIKPSNVLVALYDDKPVPKVIDFGVAKAAGQPLTEKTLHTGFGAIIGTLEYMSPEQATFNQLDIDTRSDVYSLGVLLYELLTGTTPVDKKRLKEAALLEVLRVVREEDPPRPSVKLSTAEARASIAATRGAEPDKLAKELRGELDWIVMKSLEKDRNRRYETAVGLARDVERFLKDEMVEARPPSAVYRLRKTIRKHRGAVLAGTLFLLALIGGVIGTTIGLLRAVKAEQVADAARLEAEHRKGEAVFERIEAVYQRSQALANEKKAKAEALSAKAAVMEARAAVNFFTYSMLLAASQKGPAQVTLQEVVDTAEPSIVTVFKGQARNQAQVRLIFGLMYAHWDERVKAVAQLNRALAVPGLTGEEMAAIQRQAIPGYARAGNLERAVEVTKNMLDRARTTFGPDNPESLSASARLANMYELTGRINDAEALWREAVKGWKNRELQGPSERDESAWASHGLGRLLLKSSQPAEAEPHLRAYLDHVAEKAVGTPQWLEAVNQYAASLFEQKKHAETEKVLVDCFQQIGVPGEMAYDASMHTPVIEAVNLLLRLYDETKQPEKAAEWRKNLNKAKIQFQFQ